MLKSWVLVVVVLAMGSCHLHAQEKPAAPASPFQGKVIAVEYRSRPTGGSSKAELRNVELKQLGSLWYLVGRNLKSEDDDRIWIKLELIEVIYEIAAPGGDK